MFFSHFEIIIDILFGAIDILLVYELPQRMLTNYSTDYRQILKNIFAERTNRNPSYSLRAYARDLELSPARLSGILNGRFGLSGAAAIKVGKNLKLSMIEQMRFCKLVEESHGRSEAKRKSASNWLKKHAPKSISWLPDDKFRLMSDWYYYVILELIKMKGFVWDVAWISKILNISAKKVTEALERLSRLQLIEVNNNQVKVKSIAFAESDGDKDACNNLLHQIIKKCDENTTIDTVNKYQQMWVFSFDQDRLEEAKLAVREFTLDFCRRFGKMGQAELDLDEVGLKNLEIANEKRNSVYCLYTHFLPLAVVPKPKEQ